MFYIFGDDDSHPVDWQTVQMPFESSLPCEVPQLDCLLSTECLHPDTFSKCVRGVAHCPRRKQNR